MTEIPEEAYDAAADAVAAMLRSWPASASLPHHPDLSPRDVVRAFAICALEAAALPYLAPAEQPTGTPPSVYFCHASGEVEQVPGGGFDVCCDSGPEGHTPLTPEMIDRAVAASLAAPAGDGGLREALEQLAKDRDSASGHTPSDYTIRPYELFDLLKAHPAAPAVPQPAKARRHCTCEVGMGTYPGDHHERGCQLNPVEVSDDDVEVAAQQADEWQEGLPAPIGSAVPQPVDRTRHAIWRAVYDAATEQGLQPSGVADKATEAVLALSAQPGDREALERVIARGIAEWDWDPLDWTYLDAETKALALEEAGPIADAVLVLLPSSQPANQEALRERIAEALHGTDHIHTWREDYRCDDACSIAAFRRADAVLAVLAGEQEQVEK